MHFITATLAPILAMLLLTVVSAQTPPPTSENCLYCLINASLITSPTCDLMILTSPLPADNRLSAKQIACFCPLAASNSWIQPCVGAVGGCTAADATAFNGIISAVKTVCDAGGVVAPPGTAPPTAGGSPGAGAGTGSGSGGNTNTPGTPATPKNGAGGLVLGASSNKSIFNGISAIAVASLIALLL